MARGPPLRISAPIWSSTSGFRRLERSGVGRSDMEHPLAVGLQGLHPQAPCAPQRTTEILLGRLDLDPEGPLQLAPRKQAVGVMRRVAGRPHNGNPMLEGS